MERLPTDRDSQDLKLTHTHTHSGSSAWLTSPFCSCLCYCDFSVLSAQKILVHQSQKNPAAQLRNVTSGEVQKITMTYPKRWSCIGGAEREPLASPDRNTVPSICRTTRQRSWLQLWRISSPGSPIDSCVTSATTLIKLLHFSGKIQTSENKMFFFLSWLWATVV